jgi:hypothetical protein
MDGHGRGSSVAARSHGERLSRQLGGGRAECRTLARRLRWLSGAAGTAAALTVVTILASGPQSALPPLRAQPTPQAVVNEHVEALNRCDWTRLMAQYPATVEIFLPNGEVVRGREAVGDMFRGFVRARSEQGLCGLTFVAEHTFTVGDTVNVKWRATAPFLTEPYLGADAYVTKDGLMYAQVTTFDGAALKFKP